MGKISTAVGCGLMAAGVTGAAYGSYEVIANGTYQSANTCEDTEFASQHIEPCTFAESRQTIYNAERNRYNDAFGRGMTFLYGGMIVLVSGAVTVGVSGSEASG